MSEHRKNLFGEQVIPKIANVVTFADEIKPSHESTWAYHGIVSVSKEHLAEALNRLQADRDEIGHQFEIGWKLLEKPGKNASPGKKEQLATKWLSRLVQEDDVWRFSVLGIDTSKMVMTRFGVGKGDQIANAYRRFYRANLKHHVGQLHRSHEGVNVIKTYHDEEGRLEADDWFSHHPQRVLQAEKETVCFLDSSVTFVNSCHRKETKHPKASHFVQLCDLLLGATRYVFEDVGSHLARDRVANQITPLLERLNSSQDYKNVNSKYKHVGRASLGFFPSHKLSEESLDDEFARGQSSFFRDRAMLQHRRVTGQESLFD
jgi:hypothetical protein